MAHYLAGPGGEATYLSVTGTRGRMRHHPLDAALQEQHEMPVPDPIPYDFGHALVHADMGMYVLVADPQPRQPTFELLTDLVAADPGSVGMARFELRADDQARQHYLDVPASHRGLSEELMNGLMSEPDGALRRGLMLVLGVPHPNPQRGLSDLS